MLWDVPVGMADHLSYYGRWLCAVSRNVVHSQLLVFRCSQKNFALASDAFAELDVMQSGWMDDRMKQLHIL